MNPPTTHLRPAGATVALCGALGHCWTYALVRVTCQDCLAAAIDEPAPATPDHPQAIAVTTPKDSAPAGHSSDSSHARTAPPMMPTLLSEQTTQRPEG